ncbi:hypothetical protein HF086_002915 [Spodoptera exigua]|uniref:Nuclear pore membrane glycoprotein 210 n=1 Tax=Spodoptera exigua TaxID=7107 RepID=A0A922MBZ0_SPOEX|nr:hypothetical protein HF086_002915 [Spodoptera exigua]
MEFKKTAVFLSVLCLLGCTCDGAKINTPRVLLPWFEDLNINFTFEIIEGGCYTWSLSRDDIIDLEPLYDDATGHCSRAARVSVSKSCVPPGSVIILAEEVNSGEILRGDVDIDKIRSLKVMSTTWNLFLEEAPEAFEVVAYDDQGNKFSTLEGISFTWSIENLGSNVGEDPLVTLVRWRDTDYEAPRGVTELEARGLRSHSVLLYGQAMGESRVTVCLEDICTDFNLQVIASVVLMPAIASIVPGDSLRYKVVRARAGRLTVQDITETVYYLKVPDTSIALLEDSVSLVKGTDIGTTNVYLMSGATEVATATLTVAEAHSIRVTLRPSNLVIKGEPFVVHCIVLDDKGHALMAGDQILIRLTVEGEANVDLLQSTENGTLTDAVANNAGQVSAVAIEPLEIVPPHLFVSWTDTLQEVSLKHIGGGDEPVIWSEIENELAPDPLSLTSDGIVTIRGPGQIGVLAEGEALVPQSQDSRVAELSVRDGPPPHRYPDKGESVVELVSTAAEELTLLDAIGRELLDENGPKMSWDIEPYHAGLQYQATDRLFVETHPDFVPVPVPYKYYQVVLADDTAIGWTGALKASIPEATASIQARVVAPLKCDPLKVNLAWESETVTNIATITGGSGRYAVEAPKGVLAEVEDGSLSANVLGPGSYDLIVTDLCVQGEKQLIEVKVTTSRAVGVGACVPVSALVKGVSHRYLTVGKPPEWRTSGYISVKDGSLCGLQEGTGKVRALFGGVWSPEVEVQVFPALAVVPSRPRLPPGSRVQLRHVGGPPPHLAQLHYRPTHGLPHVEVTPSGSVLGLSIATQSLLVGSPSPLWIEAGGLSAAALASLMPPPRVTWSIRDPATARIYTSHADAISIQAAETRSWDSTIEILGLSDIRTSVEGLSKEISSGDRLALAVSSVIKLKSLPRGTWKAYGDGAVTISPAGELNAVRPGHAVIVAQHKDERNNIFRETAIQVEVAVPWYCTLEIGGESPEAGLRLVMRNALGRALLAPHANNCNELGSNNIFMFPSVHGPELVIPDLDATGAFMTFQGTMEFLPGEWASELVPLSFTASGLSSGPLLCTEEQRYALEGTPIELPYNCRTKAPHTAEPVIDVINGQMGCKIIPASTVTEPAEVELCADWGTYRACTKTLLLPQIRVSTNKVSLLNPPATFTVMGHSHALKLVRLTPSPGLKLETNTENGEIIVIVTNEASTCGHGWVTVRSKLTSQELRVDVQRECDVACGTVLGALFSLLKPYMSTIVTVAAAAAAYLYIQQRMQRKAPIRMPTDPNETILPPDQSTPILNRSRTWSRSPYASSGPTAPVYGDASMLPEQSFSPNSTRNSMFL